MNYLQERKYNKSHVFLGDKTEKEYQRDRARVIHSSAFRRLQSKTQVLGIGENDFYRTRLTHSMEVAQIGSGIASFLSEKYKDKKEYTDWIPSKHLIEAICLSHDIGHPPFGHRGEIALNYFMASHGGFEGNGQTLRIASKLGKYSPQDGLALTRRAMLGLLKYPCLYSQVVNKNSYPSVGESKKTNLESWKPPKCIFDTEKDTFDWILSIFSDTDKDRFTSLKETSKHKKTLHKSFDASIMELADDIAYGIHDLEDAIELQLVNRERWQEEVAEQIEERIIAEKDIDYYGKMLFSSNSYERKNAISQLVKYCIDNISIRRDDLFEHELFRYQAIMDETVKANLNLINNFVYENVIKSTEVQLLEYKGQRMLIDLFEVLNDNPKTLLPKTTYQKYYNAPCDNKRRVICDYISGMTDNYATKIYKKIFSPDAGSIFDRI